MVALASANFVNNRYYNLSNFFKNGNLIESGDSPKKMCNQQDWNHVSYKKHIRLGRMTGGGECEEICDPTSDHSNVLSQRSFMSVQIYPVDTSTYSYGVIDKD